VTKGIAETIRRRPRDVRCTAVGPEADGRWRGVINLHDERGRFASRLHVTEPEYASSKQAIRAMDNLVKRAKNGGSIA